jgi:hypothetical protein
MHRENLTIVFKTQSTPLLSFARRPRGFATGSFYFMITRRSSWPPWRSIAVSSIFPVEMFMTT